MQAHMQADHCMHNKILNRKKIWDVSGWDDQDLIQHAELEQVILFVMDSRSKFIWILN